MTLFSKLDEMPRNRRIPVALTLLTAAILLFYSNSFTADWHYDDFHHIKENINIRKISNIPVFFRDPSTFSRNPQTAMYRPLLMTTHAINYQMGLLTSRNGYNVVWYHVTNFLFHILASFAVFFIALFLFRKRIPLPGIDPILAATFAALLFGLHTINTETVVYVSSRSSGMSAMFAFWAFYLYLKGTDGRTKAVPLIISGALYACGLLSKEIAITLPAMLIYYEVLLNSRWMEGRSKTTVLKTLTTRMIAYGLPAAGFLFVRNIFNKENLLDILTAKGGTAAAPNLSAQLATQSRVWIYYIREWLWPTSLSIDKPFSVSRHFSDPRVIVSLIILAAILAAVIAARKKHPIVTFGTLWFFTALLPTSVFRLNVVMNDHRLYLPGLGATLIFTYVAARLYVRFRSDNRTAFKTFVVVCVATLVFMGVGTFKRNMAFATEETMWKDVILKDRNSVRGYNNLGIYYEQHKELDKALRFYNKTIKLAPMFPNPYINIGNVYDKKKEFGPAEKFMKRAIQLDPRSALANYNLGNILREAGKTNEAISAYRRALRLNPRYIEAANNMANIYFKERKFREAIQFYGEALNIDPTFAMSYYNIGLANERLGQAENAIRNFKKFLKYWTGNPTFLKLARRRIQVLEGGLAHKRKKSAPQK